jgi:lysophospholipase L1-like esterase
MKRFAYIIIFVAAIIIIGYMWFAYANIYNRIKAGGLITVDTQYVYTLSASNSQKIKYAAMGDSLTAGVGTDTYEESYPYALAQRLTMGGEVILKDFSYLGARTEDLIDKNLLKGVIEDSPDIITVLIGVNDVRENISEEEFKSNYENIVNELADGTNAKIYLISIPFIGSNTLYLPPYNFYFKNKTVRFNSIIKDIATEHNLGYIDIANPTEEIFKTDGQYYSIDSFHPSKEGYWIFAGIMYDNINR